MLPQVCKGAHVFHCWLGSARVIEIHEVHGWLGQLTDRISQIHVRHIRATLRIAAFSSTCVLGANITWAAPHFRSRQDCAHRDRPAQYSVGISAQLSFGNGTAFACSHPQV
jgi:hypothetical protein